MTNETIAIIKYTATEGYIFKKKNSDSLMSSVLYLGINDNIDNYEEVLIPIEEANE